MSAAKLIRFYVYRHLKRDYVLPHKHSAYELLYYEKGAGRVMLGQNTFEYGKHSCVIIEPNLLHDDYTLEEQTVYCIQFSSDMKFASAVIAPNRNNILSILNIIIYRREPGRLSPIREGQN